MHTRPLVPCRGVWKRSLDVPGIDRARARLLYFSMTVEVSASLLLCLGGAAACVKWTAPAVSASCRIDRRVLHRRAAVSLIQLLICQRRGSVLRTFSLVGHI